MKRRPRLADRYTTSPPIHTPISAPAPPPIAKSSPRRSFGEGLTVLDDSSDWYEVRLEDGQTAFIAGFLMSKTPPGG